MTYTALRIATLLICFLNLQLAYPTAVAGAYELGTTDLKTEHNRPELNYIIEITQVGLETKAVVDSALSEFDENTLPHEAKDLRKQLVRLRDVIDIFSHNFIHELKLWDNVRDGLDEGYTVIGDYKDLYDANPEAVEAISAGRIPDYSDRSKLKARRKKVLNWKKKYFSKNGLQHDIEALFADIRPLQGEIQSSKKFSKFFWGGVNTLPNQTFTPAENARLLIDAQTNLARAEHERVLALKDPTTHAGELIFHDHRKRLRTIVKVCHVANELLSNTCDPEAVEELAKLVSQLGSIEDLIITGRHLEEDGKKSKAQSSYQEAIKRFRKIKEKYQNSDMLEPLVRI